MIASDSTHEAADLGAWLDAQQAEIERDHRTGGGIRRYRCSCEALEPCVERTQELTAIVGLRTALADNVRFQAERDDARAVALMLKDLLGSATGGLDEVISEEVWDQLPDWFTGDDNGRGLWGGGDV